MVSSYIDELGLQSPQKNSIFVDSLRFAMLREASFIFFCLSFHAFRNISSFRDFFPDADDNKIQKCKFNLRILRKQRESTYYTVHAIHVECIATDFHFHELFWQKLLFRFTLPHASGSWRRREKLLSRWLISNEIFSRLHCRSGRSTQV